MPGLSQINYNEKGSKYPELKHIFSLTTTNFQTKINLDAYRYRPQQLPFFCRMEHKIEQKSNIPFRFRIGDLNYVNALENKINTYIFAH
jgi:hypothetical protein